MTKFISKFAKDESGATAIEYGLIAAMISVIIILAFTTLRPAIVAAFTRITNSLNAAV